VNEEMKTYNFISQENCNMCKAPTNTAKVLGVRLNQSQGARPRGKTGIGVTICRCRNCGLEFPQPLPVPRSISDHYGVPPESYWQEDYFFFDASYFGKQIEEAKRLLGFSDGMTALDIGAGIGKAMIALEMAGFDVHGIEPSEPFRRKAIERMNIAEERILPESVESARFSDNNFDFITFGAVLEHLYDPSRAIEKAIGWLKPGGVVQIEVPSSDHLLPYFLNTYNRVCGTNYVTNLSPMHSPFHLFAFTRRSLQQHSYRFGYEIACSYIEVASIRHAPALVKPLLRFWMKHTDRGQQLTVWLRKP
jgi:SAM-dependent methyltransferase